MKKLDALILIILLTLTLAACGGTATPDTAKVFLPEENEALYDKYIRSIDTGMIFNSTWDDANEVDADYFMYYYAVELLHSGRSIFGENADGYIPAEELELFVQSHFDVNVEHLRTNEYYIADKNVYEFGGLGSAWLSVTKTNDKPRYPAQTSEKPRKRHDNARYCEPPREPVTNILRNQLRTVLLAQKHTKHLQTP